MNTRRHFIISPNAIPGATITLEVDDTDAAARAAVGYSDRGDVVVLNIDANHIAGGSYFSHGRCFKLVPMPSDLDAGEIGTLQALAIALTHGCPDRSCDLSCPDLRACPRGQRTTNPNNH